jgi:hypothetical protein
LPALTGNKDRDWAAFSRVYEQVAAKLADAAVRQAVAEATPRATPGSKPWTSSTGSEWSGRHLPRLPPR